jgi:hypothetical protein
MKRTMWLLATGVTLALLAGAHAASSSGQSDPADAHPSMVAGSAAATAAADGGIGKQVIVTRIPAGYRDWKFVSAAHEAGQLNDLRVMIANNLAIRAYRSGKSFPDGSIIGRVAWKMVPSDENNATFGRPQSFVPGEAPDWYLQFLEKDSKKYAATGGWGYSNFDKNLKPLTDEKTMYACFTCHKALASRDYIFTKYAP